MPGETLAPLAQRAGQMVAAAAVTDVWVEARGRFARLLGRGDARKTQVAEGWLVQAREQLTAAGPGLEQARNAVAERWAGRFADLLDEDPGAESGLRTLVAEVAAALPGGAALAGPRLRPDTADQLIALLGVYATQYASYTTLLWQVPALSLTAQAFLLTIALSHGNGTAAKVTVSALSMLISIASRLLMHDQRGHAINYGELAENLSRKLDLVGFLGGVTADDGEPEQTDAADLWTWHGPGKVIKGRPSHMYFIWNQCILLFAFVSIGVICSTFMPLLAAVLTAAGLGVLTEVLMDRNSKRAHIAAEERLSVPDDADHTGTPSAAGSSGQ